MLIAGGAQFGGGGRHMPAKIRVEFVVGVLLLLTIAGCGTSEKRPTDATTLNRPWQQLVRSTVATGRMHGGRFAIVARRYEYRRKFYSVLEAHVSRTNPGKTFGGGGPSIESDRQTSIEIEVEHGCVGNMGYALAYGMLRNREDTVVSRGTGGTVPFDKVSIPSQFRPDGVLVYAFLGGGPASIVALNKLGEEVSRESVWGQEQASCRVAR